MKHTDRARQDRVLRWVLLGFLAGSLLASLVWWTLGTCRANPDDLVGKQVAYLHQPPIRRFQLSLGPRSRRLCGRPLRDLGYYGVTTVALPYGQRILGLVLGEHGVFVVLRASENSEHGLLLQRVQRRVHGRPQCAVVEDGVALTGEVFHLVPTDLPRFRDQRGEDR